MVFSELVGLSDVFGTPLGQIIVLILLAGYLLRAGLMASSKNKDGNETKIEDIVIQVIFLGFLLFGLMFTLWFIIQSIGWFQNPCIGFCNFENQAITPEFIIKSFQELALFEVLIALFFILLQNNIIIEEEKSKKHSKNIKNFIAKAMGTVFIFMPLIFIITFTTTSPEDYFTTISPIPAYNCTLESGNEFSFYIHNKTESSQILRDIKFSCDEKIFHADDCQVLPVVVQSAEIKKITCRPEGNFNECALNDLIVSNRRIGYSQMCKSNFVYKWND